MTQLDISNAFPHKPFEEPVFMEHLQCLIDLNFPTHVQHLHKALYNL